MELTALRVDLAEAQGLGWVADELHLHLEIQRAAAELQLRAWQHTLMERFGPEVGAKLSQHQVEVGMSWEHLVFSYGPPPTGAITLLGKEPTHLAVQYGSKVTGSYFEVIADVVTVARLGVPTMPAHLLELCA